ncbi:MAG: hypothetical protein IIC04_05000 [Proteobacteria bacterium]|nr:hypothetical protein [Pseudomonadota bacterium]
MEKPLTKLEEDFDCVGSSIGRVDARRKVTGRAEYLEDIKLTGMLYGKMLRSTQAHARIISIDTSEAEKLPGVKGVVTGADLDFLHGESLSDEPYLARGKVRYVGEAVAGVAAEDEATADAARALDQGRIRAPARRIRSAEGGRARFSEASRRPSHL